MIKKLLILSLAVPVIFTSCSGNDDDNNQQVSIVGKWANIDFVIDGISEPYDDHEACGKDYIEFKSDNTYIAIDVLNCEEIQDEFGTYLVNGSSITVGNEFSGEITQLTATRLSLKTIEDYDGDGTLDEVVINFERL